MAYVVDVENLLVQKKEKESFNLTVAPELFVTSELEQLIEQIVTEDDTPVDNIFSAKQQRLLVEPLYSSWQIEGRIFVADSNVGLFNSPYKPPIVPDMFLSMDVKAPEDNWWEKKNRSYFIWEFGKPPDVVIEIVSNKKGREESKKFLEYARIGIQYYIIYDPQKVIQDEELKVFELSSNRQYSLKQDYHLDRVGLTLTLWEGVFECSQDEEDCKETQWLRWCSKEGELIPTGAERAEYEHKRAEQGWERAKQEYERAEKERKRAKQEYERAEKERERAEKERERAEKLAAQLRALGIELE